MADTTRHPDCLKTQQTKCKLRSLLPVRFAVTSEKQPPLWGSSITGREELIPLAHYQYTLRTVQNGYVFITWDGLRDEDILVYEGNNYVFTEVTNHGYGRRSHCVRIPDDPGITEIYISYVRIPEAETNTEEKNAQQTGSPTGDEPAWRLVAKNLLAKKTELMQLIKLQAPPYSSAREQIFELVEEFRKHAEDNRLLYLKTWPKSRKYFEDRMDTADKRECWEASVDEGYHVWESVHDMYIPQDTVLVALHDSIGQVYDFASIYHKSFAGMRNFERYHSHMHTSGFMYQEALDSFTRQLKDKAEAERQELIREYGLSPMLATQRIPGDSLPMPDKLTFRPVHDFSATHAENSAPSLNSCHSSYLQRDAAERKVRLLENYDPTTDPKYTDVFGAQDIGGFKPYREYCTAAMKVFSEEARMALVDWFTLLSADQGKKFSLHWTLREIFKSDDQGTGGFENYAKRLTQARDAIFIVALTDIGNYSTTGDSGSGSQSAHYELMYTNLAKSKGFMDLFEHVTGTGGVPYKSYSSLVKALGGFIAYCNKEEGDARTVAETMLGAFAKRFALPKPERTLEGPLALIDATVLGNMVQHLDERTISPDYGWGDVGKPSSDLALFFDIFNEQYLTKMDPGFRVLLDEIKEARKDLALGKDVAKARSNLDAATSKLQRRLEDHGVQLVTANSSMVTDKNGKPWKIRGVGQEKQKVELGQRKGESPTLSLQGTHKMIAFHVTALSGLLAVCNSVHYAHEVVKYVSKGQGGKAVLQTVHMLPHALTAAETVFKAFGKAALVRRFLPFSLVTGAISDTIMTVDLAMSEDWDAALGCGMMAASGVALTGVLLTGGTLGLATLSTPVTAVLFALFATGFVVYMVCKDSDLEKYLKNGLWSKKGKKLREALPQRMGYSAPYKKSWEWEEQRREVEEYLQKFFPVGITLFYDGKHVYVGLSMPLSGEGSKKLEVYFGSESPYISIDSEDAVAGPVEERVNGLHLFDACFDVAELKAHSLQKMLSLEDGNVPLPRRVLVKLSYKFSEDIAYDTATAHISVDYTTPATEENKIARSRMTALLQNATPSLLR